MNHTFAIPAAVTPKGALLFGLLVAAASTLGLPYVTGYGPQLFQVVVLAAWSGLSAVSSSVFADHNPHLVWLLAAALNTFLFSLLALPLYFGFRRQMPATSTMALIVWLALYVCCLFVLFPATDGP